MSGLVTLCARGLTPAKFIFQDEVSDTIDAIPNEQIIPFSRVRLVAVVPYIGECSGLTKSIVKLNPLVSHALELRQQYQVPYVAINIQTWNSPNNAIGGTRIGMFAANINLYDIVKERESES